MIRVSVVSKSDIYKYLLKLIFVIIIFFVIVKVYKYSKIHFSQKQITVEQGITYLKDEITAFGSNDNFNILEVDSKNLIDSELRMSVAVSSRETSTITEELADDEKKSAGENEAIETVVTKESKVEEISDNVQTEIIPSKYKDAYNFEYNGVKIKNESDFDLAEMDLASDILTDNKNVIIYHTHTCESYTPTEQNNYDSSGNYRTTDLNYTVAKVGDVLDEYLSGFGFNVIHDKTYHDYPAYSGSYGRSLTTVSNILAKSEKTDILIDLHRDAIGDDTYAPKVKIGDEYAAQIMFVIGTNGSGLEHPNWKHNLEFAIKVQQRANEMYPGLFKSILVRNARYNQNLGANATIIEFGATGNTLEECEVSAKYLAKVLNEVCQ